MGLRVACAEDKSEPQEQRPGLSHGGRVREDLLLPRRMSDVTRGAGRDESRAGELQNSCRWLTSPDQTHGGDAGGGSRSWK
jgi:hypothetical protein